LKNAFWAYSTGVDIDVYRPHYLLPDAFNWKTFSGKSFEIWQGVTLYHVPGHTEGSIMMELELEKQGAVVLTGDLFHVKENYEDGRCQGIIMRDFNEWTRSRTFVQALVRKKKAKVLLGHEESYFNTFVSSPGFTE
jgi:glyoxylase-like metal-dependent hydrolase (beta-lactamase superfamily II)